MVARVPFIKVVASCLLAIVVTLGSVGDVQAQVPPDETWRTLETEHFRVTFPDSLETLGHRAAARAEDAWLSLSGAFVEPPSGRIDLLITDHTDVSNGYASVTPSNRITVHARPPVDDLALGYFDEWMELVVVHELAHIFHLDMTGALGRVFRSVFGRVPEQWPYFPAQASPRWAIEGLATWYESDLTDAGRTRGSYHDMVLRTAAMEGRFESLDQASGESPVWPAGNRAYIYGSMFFQHLLAKHGADRMGAFAEAVAGQWIPYRLDAAGRDAFGVSLSEEWRAWTEELEERYQGLAAELARTAPVTEGARLTPDSRIAWFPRISPDGTTLAYASVDGRTDAQVRVADPDGSDPRRFVRTSSVADFDWLPDGSVVFSQLDFEGPYRVFGDLEVAGASGDRRRVTRGARLSQPSAGPLGRLVVAVQEGGGTNGLVRVDLASGAVTEIVAPQPEVHWTRPAVSPDGRWIAVGKWTPGAYLDVVVLDMDGREALRLTRDRALDMAPSWTPDGRTLLWTSDRTGILNILAADVDPDAGQVGAIRMATNVTTGAAYPSVDPSGQWLYFSGYHADGWEVERVLFRAAAWPEAPGVAPRFQQVATLPEVDPGVDHGVGEVRSYSALPTLLPRYWEPLAEPAITTAAIQGADFFIRKRELLGPSLGAQTSGRDLVGRHTYYAFARFFTDGGGKADWGGSYAYAGFGVPTLGLSYYQSWDDDGVRLGRAADDAPLDTLFVLERDRTVNASATFLRRTWRSTLSATFAGGLSWEDRTLLDNALRPSSAYRLTNPSTRLSDASVTLSFGTARSHSFQMGASEGLSVWVRGRTRRDLTVGDSVAGVAGYDRSVDEVRGALRGYLSLGGPGFASHVLAFRVAGGVAGGPNAHATYFEVGGSSGTPEDITGQNLFGGSPLFFAVRGYPTGSRYGRLAWTASGEYRFPLAILNRGLGAWPLHVDRLLGSLFVDAGNAWGPQLDVDGYRSPRRATLMSAGAELLTDVLTFWNISSRVRVGVALPLVEADGAVTYLRLGLPF